MEVIKRTYQEKEGRHYKTTAEQTGEVAASAFMEDLMVRYVWKGNITKRIVDRPNYNGTRTVTTYYEHYDYKARAIYLIKE